MFKDKLILVLMTQRIEKKLILVGDGGVGKSSLVKRLISNTFDPIYKATLGYEVFPYVDQQNDIQYNIWDVAGQEKFNGLKDAYYLESNIAIIMCDDRNLTRKSINCWRTRIRHICPSIPILVICNKIDVKDFRESMIDHYISVKNNIGIDELFNLMNSLI